LDGEKVDAWVGGTRRHPALHMWITAMVGDEARGGLLIWLLVGKELEFTVADVACSEDWLTV